MTTLYQKYLVPIRELQQSMATFMAGRQSLSPREADDLIQSAREAANMAVERDMANMTTSCENNQTIAANLALLRALRGVEAYSKVVSFPPANLVLLRHDMESLAQLIYQSNNKEKIE